MDAFEILNTAAFTLAGGSAWVAAVLVIMFFAVIYGLNTVRGSGIAQRPYFNNYTDAPGAVGSSSFSRSDVSEHLDWSRGTR